MIQTSSLLAIMLIPGIALSGGGPVDQFNMTGDSLQEDVKVMENIGDDSLDRNSTVNFKDLEQPENDFQEQNSTEIIEAVDLPADPFTIEMVEELRHVLEENKDGGLSEETNLLLDELEGKARQKREMKVNDAYCCAQHEPSQRRFYQTKILSRTIVSYSSTQHGYYRCDWFSGRCYYPNQYPVYRRQYYHQSYPVWAPAPEWTNGCPARLIRCCGGYGRFNNQCLSYDEISNVFRLQRLYPEFDFICSMLGMCGGDPYSRCDHTDPVTPEPSHGFPTWNRD